MRKYLTGATFIVAFGCGISLGFAGDHIAVQGQLRTPAGKPVKGYPVIVTGKTSSGDTKSIVTSTDQSGQFVIHGLPPGTYAVAPANEPNLKKTFRVGDFKKWYEFWKPASTAVSKDLGTISVPIGNKF